MLICFALNRGFAFRGLPGAVLSVPMLAVIRILLTRADHPMAKRVLHVIRENNSIDGEIYGHNHLVAAS